ncbi:hypothetical protein [Oerskovia sp. Root22]|uniref:hypothetical protein n=1 Tax=Oerskovia sp. Root22 TaxID=1736494 RepID=UPI000A59CA59|nr:hypothetical protein [Oerskovia sp. Root22]
MPRLTSHRFIKQHHLLKKIWEVSPNSFADLSFNDQRHLHDFFQLTHLLSDKELLAHREHITQQRPALPQQAGRALRRLLTIDRRPPDALLGEHITATIQRGWRTITVRALARPEIDTAKLSRMFAEHIRDQVRQVQQTRTDLTPARGSHDHSAAAHPARSAHAAPSPHSPPPETPPA